MSCALIQETHLKQSDVARFQNKYYKLAAFSCAQNKTKGVLILVNRKLNLTIEHLGSDEKGRFVFIRCKIYNNRLALVSIYVSRILAMNFPSFTTRGHSPTTWTFTQLQITHRLHFPSFTAPTQLFTIITLAPVHHHPITHTLHKPWTFSHTRPSIV